MSSSLAKSIFVFLSYSSIFSSVKEIVSPVWITKGTNFSVPPEFENTFLSILSGIDRYEVNGNDLLLKRKRETMLVLRPR